MLGNLTTQTARLLEYFGWSVIAPLFFVALLHPFKRSETAVLRWMLLAMWGGALLGMALYGLGEEQGVAANQLHLLFVPMFTCFGLAFLLMQWNRLEIDLRIARLGFLSLLYLLCALPMISTVVAPRNRMLIRWPPYAPPSIAVLNEWMKPDEIIASDMPWAVAWYADRRSVWLPENLKALTDLNDYRVLGGPVNGLYLTPVSGTQNTLGDIMKGEYQDWSAVIVRTVNLEKFPLKWAALLGLENECILFSDHDRRSPPAK